MRIDATRDLRRILNRVESPGRYVGGEWGSVYRDDDATVRVALTFPELYEIGMSNTAIKILYGILNGIRGVACERVFVPAPDFEDELSTAAIPLYTLESGIPLHETDMLAVSFGYELLATNLLTILRSGGIALRSVDRRETDPIVLLGGPGATNPTPIAPFVDGVFIGEAEAALPELVRSVVEAKKRGAQRSDLIEIVRSHHSVWSPGRTTPVRRAIWNEFGASPTSIGNDWKTPGGGNPSYGVGFPVPSIPVIQDHGVVEIMRGCPQGCRFCHAGMFYRPYRMKTIEEIIEEVRWLVETMGYREISLSSLSTGDYYDIVQLVRRLVEQFSQRGVSFSLPSLRVNSVTLPIFEAISRGKRSGLTFAVESADEEGQRGINKLVPLQRVIDIAAEARRRGWKHAKLYFMIGLPVTDRSREGAAIAEYVAHLRKQVPLEYIVNVGTFVPKPHTPFQWDRQLDPDDALSRIAEIRSGLPRGAKLRAHDPWNSWLEGIITRGNEKTADLIETAFNRGARLDAWDEYAKIGLWRELAATDEYRRTVADSLGGRRRDEATPWSSIQIGVSERLLRDERERAERGELTERCRPNCERPCGICNRETVVRDYAGDQIADQTIVVNEQTDSTEEVHGREYQLVVRYQKFGAAAYLPHLALVRTFERVWHRTEIPILLSRGYHPKPKMSFGQPLPLGSESDDELVIVNLQKSIHIEKYYQRFRDALPAGLSVTGMILLHHEKGSRRIPTPMQRYGGSFYRLTEFSEADDSTARRAALQEYFSEYRPRRPFYEANDNARTHDRKGIDDGSVTVYLPDSAPGMGRLLKTFPYRDSVAVRRLLMVAADSADEASAIDTANEESGAARESDRAAGSTALFDYYRGIENCVDAVDERSAGERI